MDVENTASQQAPKTAPGRADAPVYEPDLFAPAALQSPFAHYRAMRDLAPVVRLRDPDAYALARFDDVRAALLAPDTLICAKGVGFNDQFNTPGNPNLLASDGDQHSRMRREVIRPMIPGQLKQHRAMLREMISARVKALVDQGPFDAMTQIAQFLPLSAISVLVGLPEEGRAAMLDWASATFNMVGPERAGSDQDSASVAGWRRYITNLKWTDLNEGGWARDLLAAVESGRLSEAEGRGALSAYIIPSLDTTILAKGHLLYALGCDPAQWDMLRRDPSLAAGAVLESVRHSAVVRWFSRYATADYAVGQAVIPQGARVMLIYASANRDERKFADPDRFDITRDARLQLAWGVGTHLCGGLHLAKLEMEVMLEALLEHCATIEVGEPEVGTNRGLYGFVRLPLELRSGR